VIRRVEITDWAAKQLARVPQQVQRKLAAWVGLVELDGVEQVRKMPGFHDEPLKGKRKGERSIRLNQAYRAIYVIKKDGAEFIRIEEVSKHDY